MAGQGEHCWHHTGRVATLYPVVELVRCCFCGKVASRRSRPVAVPGHGRHVRVEREEFEVDCGVPCVPRPTQTAPEVSP